MFFFSTPPSLELCLWAARCRHLQSPPSMCKLQTAGPTPLLASPRPQPKPGRSFIDWLVNAVLPTCTCCSAVTQNCQLSILQLGRYHLEVLEVLCFWLDVRNRKLAECQRSLPIAQTVIPLALSFALHRQQGQLADGGLLPSRGRRLVLQPPNSKGLVSPAGLWVGPCQQDRAGQASLGGVWEEAAGPPLARSVLCACWASALGLIEAGPAWRASEGSPST